MAKKKKKGKSPEELKRPKRKRKSFTQIIWYVIGLLVIISMLVGTVNFQ